MNRKKILFICILTFLLAFGLTSLVAYASNTEDSEFKFPWFWKKAIESNLTDEQKSEIESKMAEIQSIIESSLTDEQKAEWAERQERQEEMKSKRAEMESRMKLQLDKWGDLTDEQKAELYSLQDKSVDAQIAIIDKYLELGVIDEEKAQAMKDRLLEGNDFMRENDFMPGFGFGGVFKDGFGHGRGWK